MSSLRCRRSAALSIAALSLLLGCAEQQESLIVLHAVAWEDGCTFDAGSDMVLDRGTLDVSFGSGYIAPIAILNQLMSNTSNGVEAGEIQLTSVDVELSLPQAPDVIDRVRERDENLVKFRPTIQSQSIAPGEIAGVFVDVLNSEQTNAITEELLVEFGGDPVDVTLAAKMKFHGLRTGNSVGGVGDVHAREYQFPVYMCMSCLVDCSGCDEGICPADATMWSGGVCGNAQDLLLYPSTCNAPE